MAERRSAERGNDNSETQLHICSKCKKDGKVKDLQLGCSSKVFPIKQNNTSEPLLGFVLILPLSLCVCV